MGQIANQMLADFLSKIGSRIKEKSADKKYAKKIDKDVLLKAIEYLEAPHEVSVELAEVPDYVLRPLGFFDTDVNYLKNHDRIKEECIGVDQMGLDDIRTMFTFFNRGERFSTGFTAEIINNGELLSVYKRLEEISEGK